MISPPIGRLPVAARQRSGDSGYSLLELLISMVVMTLLLGALYGALFQSQATYDVESDAADLRQSGRVGAELLAHELRMAGADIGNLPQILFRGAPYEIAFVADIDNDDPALPCDATFETAVDGGAEGIVYGLATGTLTRRVSCWDGTSWTVEYLDQPVIDNVANATLGIPIYRYFDEDSVELVPGAGGLTAAQLNEVRAIRITIVLDDGVDHVLADALTDFRIVTQVKLRNAGLQ